MVNVKRYTKFIKNNFELFVSSLKDHYSDGDGGDGDGDDGKFCLSYPATLNNSTIDLDKVMSTLIRLSLSLHRLHQKVILFGFVFEVVIECQQQQRQQQGLFPYNVSPLLNSLQQIETLYENCQM